MNSIKCNVMKNMIDNLKRKDPFDYQDSENFNIYPSMDDSINNCHYFSAHKDDVSFYCRLGLRRTYCEVWVCYCEGKKAYTLKEMIYKSGKSPLKIKKEFNCYKYTINFDGILENEDEKKHFVINATFNGTNEPISFFNSMPSIRLAKALCNEKWEKGYFEKVTAKIQTHYKVEGTLDLSVSYDNQSVNYKLPCIRDHNFGKREWKNINNHLYLSAVSDDVEFNYSMISYSSIPILEVGNFRYRNELTYLMQIEYDKKCTINGDIIDGLTMNILLSNKKNITVILKTITSTTYSFDDGEYIITECIANFLIDNHQCRGIVEFGLNKDTSCYYNGMKLEELTF